MDHNQKMTVVAMQTAWAWARRRLRRGKGPAPCLAPVGV